MSSKVFQKLSWGTAALALATATTAFTTSMVLEGKSPTASLAIWAGNGSARAQLADREFGPQFAAEVDGRKVDAAALAHSVVEARRALASEPLNPRAMRIIALGSTSDNRRQFEMLKHVGRLTRRDTLTQLSLVQRFALSDDLTEAMTQYDALLRRDTGARDIAGRALAKATADQRVTTEVERMLRADPSWKSLLFYYLLREPGSWDGFIRLHHKLDDTDIIPVETSVEFANQMMAAGRFADAVEITRLIGAVPITRATSIADKEFLTEPPVPGSWAVRDPASASLQPLAEGGALLNLGRSASGIVARRLLALKPGRYRAKLTYEGFGDSNATRDLEARLICAGTNNGLAGTQGLRIGADCPFQWLSLYIDRLPLDDQELMLKVLEVSSDD